MSSGGRPDMVLMLSVFSGSLKGLGKVRFLDAVKTGLGQMVSGVGRCHAAHEGSLTGWSVDFECSGGIQACVAALVKVRQELGDVVLRAYFLNHLSGNARIFMFSKIAGERGWESMDAPHAGKKMNASDGPMIGSCDALLDFLSVKSEDLFEEVSAFAYR